MNIQEIKQNYRIEDVIGNSIQLKRQGPEWVGNCPFHDDSHASLKINPVKQIFKCFPCGSGGDMFDFFTLQGYKMSEAASMITSNTIIPIAAHTEKQPDVIWEDAIPNQENLPDVINLNFPKYGKPNRFWSYTNSKNQVNGYVLRFDLPEGKKDVIPYTYKKRTENGVSKSGWFWRGFEVKRPLYNLGELAERPKAIVLMVEGEKTAEAAKLLFPQYVVTTWIGGGENVKNADLSPLTGRNVFLWPDNDLPGIHCMFGGWSKNEKTGVYRRINGVSELVKANFKRIQNQKEFPKKWDVADADWTHEQAAEYIKQNRTDIPAVSEHAPNESPVLPPAAVLPPVVPTVPAKTKTEEKQAKNPYFKCLGIENNDQNLYVFFVFRANVIIKLSASGISTSNLLQLAPLNYWEGHYPKQSRSGAGVKYDLNIIADNLISTCLRLGIFNPSKIRGRGAWIDNGVPVIHCGDSLIVDGKYKKFSEHKSKFTYEAGQELGFTLTDPLNKHEAYKLINLMERLNWSRDINARLVAGWIVIAPLCGALKWRPHIWLTGPAGSGKSEIMKFIKSFMGNFFIDAQSETTEAGIRQFLKSDALSVIFDEAESEDKRSDERMQSVLSLVRSSSTSDSGMIIKGSSNGNAAQFDLRSCFAFASIGVNLTQKSDLSRVTVLEIKTDTASDKRDRWQKTLEAYNEINTQEYVQGFQSRALMLLPTILANAKTFSNAAASELDNQRAGDQLGALLAGAYSLTSDKIISFEQAAAWINERDWTEERLADSVRDEIKVINKIMDSETQVETAGNGQNSERLTRSIGELVIGAFGGSTTETISQETCSVWLKRLGFKVEGEFLIISDNSDYIRKSLAATAYAKIYHTILIRVPGAQKIESTPFGSHIKSRATKIKMSEIFGDLFQERLAEEQRILNAVIQGEIIF